MCLYHRKMHVINQTYLENAFHRWYEGLHRYAFTLLEDNDVAKDVVQQVFFNLWEKRDTLQINISIGAYLYRAVYNGCINQRARVARHGPVDPDGPQQIMAAPDLLSEVKELQFVLSAAIADLPPQCKVVFLKSREEEKSYASIAEELGISIKTVEAQISKALKILRSALEKYQL